MVHELESPGVLSKTHSAFSSPIWPVHKSKGEWRLTVEYHGLNEVTSASAAVLDVLNLQCGLESMAAKWYHHRQNSFIFLHSLIRTVQAQFAFSCRGIQCSPRAGNTAPHYLPWHWKRVRLRNSCSTSIIPLYKTAQQRKCWERREDNPDPPESWFCHQTK